MVVPEEADIGAATTTIITTIHMTGADLTAGVDLIAGVLITGIQEIQIGTHIGDSFTPNKAVHFTTLKW